MLLHGPCLVLALLSASLLEMASSKKADETTLDRPFQSSIERLSHAACVTLYHRNGRFGCGTVDRETQTGVLKLYDGTDPGDGDASHVFVLDENDMTANTIETIVSNNRNGKLMGILVLNSTSSESQPSVHSPDAQSPQGANTPSSSLSGDSDYIWNGNGDGLVYKDLYGIPMAYVLSADVSSYVRSVSEESDKKGSIVAEFNYYMGPDSIASQDCLAWKDVSNDEWNPKCLPLGGTSVWAVAGTPEIQNERKLEDVNNGKRPLVMAATSIDATAMFHDASPGANTAASNILALLMASRLIGENVADETLDGLPRRILFAFFQGESYGFVGSRAFLRDIAYPGFQCDDGLTVPSVAKDEESPEACLHPLRPSLDFQNLGEVAGMITVDQIGVLANQNTMYAHNDGDDDSFGSTMSQILQASSTSSFSVSAASAYADDDDYPYPPTPLTSLIQLSEGAVTGVVLAGFNDAYVNDALYHSHLDSNQTRPIDMDAVAAAATLLARSVLAAAYTDGDADEAAQYAANLIPEMSSDDEKLVAISGCLLSNGLCDLIRSYSKVESMNDFDATGIKLGQGAVLGSPPNYYTSIYDINNGQPFVQVNTDRYGSYTEDKYGKKDTDAVAMRPTSLEMTIHGLLNDFLGRGSVTASSGGQNDNTSLKPCKSRSDCSDISYCSEEGDHAVCSGGGVCVCSRAHYHIALDEALEAAPNNRTGRFIVTDNFGGISPIFTEPYWSKNVGVRVYRDAGNDAGNAALAVGLISAAGWCLATFLLKRKLKKEKLY